MELDPEGLGKVRSEVRVLPGTVRGEVSQGGHLKKEGSDRDLKEDGKSTKAGRQCMLRLCNGKLDKDEGYGVMERYLVFVPWNFLSGKGDRSTFCCNEVTPGGSLESCM